MQNLVDVTLMFAPLVCSPMAWATPMALNPAQLKTTSRSRRNGKKISSMLSPV
nr:MAG TPA: hypothetical protein [Bacteriophage sp.]